MHQPAPGVSEASEYPDPLARADVLEREITALCAQINAAGYRLLRLIADLDDLKPWGAWGLASCAHWLNWRCGIGLNAAREKVRVAHALKQLPLISATFAAGVLSFSKVRAITRIAAAENEAELLELARHATAAQVEKLVRGYRRVGRLEERESAEAQQAARELTYYFDEDGSLVIRARLPAEEGAVVLGAMNAAMDAQRAEERDAGSDDVTAVTSEDESRFAQRAEEEEERDAGGDDVTAVTSENEDPIAQRRADALTAMAEAALSSGPAARCAADRYQVVVHVTAETLAADAEADGRSELECGQRLAPDTTRRIACDGSLLRITVDAAGNPLDIGRKTRAVPPAIRRALQLRDGDCRFPGCTRHRFVDAHHIRHWADGGDTSMENLVLLCRRHHRLVHEGGFGVERGAAGNIRFSRPDGRPIEPYPQLPARGGVEGLLQGNREAGITIDASLWIVPGDSLDYGIAIEGLLRKREQKGCGCRAAN